MPRGALRQATNVVLRRDGVLEPRIGFKNAYTAPGDQSVRHAMPLSTETLLYLYDTAGTPYWRCARLSDGTNYSIVNYLGDNNFSPPSPFRIGPRAVEARGNVYLAHHGCTLKIDDLTGTTAVGAGLLASLVSYNRLSTSTGTALPTGKVVRYRAVLVRTDANGYEVRSAPGPSFTVGNSTGATKNVIVRLYNLYDGYVTLTLATSLRDGDVLELYRSRAFTSGTTPDDELFLVSSQTITLADFSTLSDTMQTSSVYYTEITDSTSEATLGAALYTNPGQEGILASNRPPPSAHDVVQFKRSTFYFNIRPAPSITLKLEGVFQYFQGIYTGDTSSGSNQILNCSGTAVVGTYVQVGQTTISGSDYPNPPSLAGTFPPGTYVVSQVGTTVTVSANATATASTVTVFEWGVITVDGFNIYYRQGTAADYTLPSPQLFANFFDASQPGLRDEMASNLVDAINRGVPNIRATLLTEGNHNIASILLEKYTEDGADFTVSSLESGIFLPETSSGLSSARDTQPGGFAWSKTDLPEAVPVINYAFINERNEAILGAKALRDGIVVFTENALYRISRYGEEAPRVDLLDPSLRLIAPNSLAVLDNLVYAWTNRGIVSVSEGGAVNELSEPSIPDAFRDYSPALITAPTLAGGPHGTANPPHNEYIITVVGTDGLPSSAAFVWNTKTQSWVRWSFSSYSIVLDETNQRLLLADDGELREERTSDTYPNADGDQAITLSGVSGTLATSSVSLLAGDAIEQSGSLYTVFTGGTSVVVDRAGLVNGAATSYRRFVSTFGFVAEHQNAPERTKTWQATQWLFKKTQNLRRVTFGYSSTISPTPYSETVNLVNDVSDMPQNLRHWAPRQHGWSERIFPTIEISAAGSRWQLEGFAIEAEVESSAGRRAAS